jgi:dTDP-4-dehydrorhamnose 3,5-epimerase
MKFNKSKLFKDVILIKPERYLDERGYFQESYNHIEYNKIFGEDVDFVQDNLSFSTKGVFRGIHLQKDPYAQGKLVQVIIGEVLDYIVDLREDSPTYLKWEKYNLSNDNGYQLWIPKGFGHAFLTLSDKAYFHYKTTNFYDKESEVCIRWDDPKINLDVESIDGYKIKISDKDKNGETL